MPPRKNTFNKVIEKAIEENPPSPPQEKTYSLPGGLLTLLDIPERKELPVVPLGNRPLLVDLIEYNPDTYAQYLIYLRLGAYYHTAAEAVGIPQKTLQEWGRKGAKDIEDGKDTYYSRFYHDTRRAVAQCRVKAEIGIMELNPQKWLSLGPGKIFGTEWAENPTQKILPGEEPVEKPMIPFSSQEKVVEKKNDSVYELDISEQLGALEALEEAGQGTFSEEYKDALRKQSNQKGNSDAPSQS